MQELFLEKRRASRSMNYNCFEMARRLTKPRPKQGQLLAQLRMKAGLTQHELADSIGEPQSNVAFWEQSKQPPRSDVLPKLAKVFGIGIEDLLNGNTRVDNTYIERKSGPKGKVRHVFEEVSKLPRRQQEKVVEFVSAFVKQYAINE